MSVILDRHSRIAVPAETAFYKEFASKGVPDDPTELRARLASWPRLRELGLDVDAVIKRAGDPQIAEPS